MKLPRDLSGRNLIKRLTTFGYEVTRQTGSHIRLTTSLNGEHHVSIPAHDALRVGTLSNIVNEVANHFEISRDEVIRKISK